MIKVFIYKKKKVQYLPILYPNFGVFDTPKTPFVNKALSSIKDLIVEVVDNPKDSDYICIPHDWAYVKKDVDYLNEYLKISSLNKKPLIIFATGDSPNIPNIPNSIIFRTSQYNDVLKSNEVIIPGYVEDLLMGKKLKIRQKKENPSISFCGWASYDSLSRKLKSYLKNIRYDLLCTLTRNSKWNTRKQGVFFRKKAISILAKEFCIKTNFIIRTSYSGHLSSMKIPAKQAREEYTENMNNSDYVLTPKGDGNYSLRFYEALSLGRIPVFVDTNCVLPLEYKIQYKDFCVFVDCKNINNIDKELLAFHKNLSDGEFENMQKNARKAFDEYLRIDTYFEFVFNHLEEVLQHNKNTKHRNLIK